MKYIRRTSKEIKDDFLNQLLLDREVIKDNEDFKEKFFNPTVENLLEDTNLDHMEEGYELLISHLKKGSKLYICVDADMDGFTSSAELYLYLEKTLKTYYPNFTIEYHIPEGKEHGLKTLMDDLMEYKKYDLIIMPDASSNDYECHSQLTELDYDILVLDHHLAERYSENAVVINNQLSQNYENKNLSGVGVVYKFLDFIDKKLGIKEAHNYLDLVALGQISDVMNMNTLENRLICDYGLSHINNFFFKTLVKKQAYSLFGVKAEDWTDEIIESGKLTQIGVAFYITPLVNALIRVGSQMEKEKLFLAFIDGEKEVQSTKRGAGKNEIETLAEQVARICSSAKNKQNKEKEKAAELLNIQIMENCLDDNKILILNADELDIPNTLTGLCAMGVAAEHKKPTLLGRINSEGYFKGSGRGCDGSELKDFRGLLLQSGLVNFAEGHASAFGCSLKESNISKLYDYMNEKLKNVDFNEGFYEADFIMDGRDDKVGKMIFDIDKGSKFWGQGNPQPVVIVENITVPATQIDVIGSNKDTIRFNYNGITYIKFKATDLIEEISSMSGVLKITVAGKGNINSWGGMKKPQILLDEIEIKEDKIYEF